MVMHSVSSRLCRTAQTSPRFVNYALNVLVFAALVVLTLSLVAAAVMRRSLGGGDLDLGWVSERWLAEQRADSTRTSLS